MASGYDISASTSTSTATNSAAGPATSGGVSLGNVTVGTTGSGLYFTAPGSGASANVTPYVIGAVIAAGLVWYFLKKKA